MIRYIKHWLWFYRESYFFIAPKNLFKFAIEAFPKAHYHAKSMCQWDKMTPQQREAWYLSGEGRTIEI